MKRILIPLMLLLALTASGCDSVSKVGQIISAATSTVTNPVDARNVYQVKNAYAAALELAVEYRRYCWSKPWDNIVGNAAERIDPDPIMKSICEHRREVVRAMKSYRPRVADAIRTAEKFVRDNPTLNAKSVIDASWNAVMEFQNLVPRAR